MARRSNTGTIGVDDRVLGILAGFRCTDNVAHRHEETLVPKDYKALNEILEALGGKWSRHKNGHVFPEGVVAADLLEGAMLTGSVKDPKVGDFFRTPESLASRMATLAGLKPGMSVLEPSAGDGRIAKAARRAGATVLCVEKDKDRRDVLLHDGFEVHVEGDFMVATVRGNHDAVMMNPPFSREQDIAHVTRALKFVRPGGKLVAITGPGWKFRETKAAEVFRSLVDHRDAMVDDLPEGTFKEEGTMVRACLLTVHV